MRPVRKADNLPPSCAVVKKFGHLNFLERSGPLRACNGTALPLPLPYKQSGRCQDIDQTAFTYFRVNTSHYFE